jgi:hypothetical protein
MWAFIDRAAGMWGQVEAAGNKVLLLRHGTPVQSWILVSLWRCDLALAHTGGDR